MMVNIIVMGAKGRMGSTIAGLAQADPELVLAAVIERPGAEAGLDVYGCEVATGPTGLAGALQRFKGALVIDFTQPECSLATAQAAAEAGARAVIGTTGLSADQLAALKTAAVNTPLLWAPNMSVGINTLLSVLPQLAQKLGPGFDLEVMEIHHNKKADSPSGTALKLGECLAAARNQELDQVKRCCREGLIGARPAGEIGLQTIRGGDVAGDHTIYFLGQGERIEVTHRAHSRENLARGALRAAKWLAGAGAGKLYGMADVLGL
ncbi:MAG: 4-hydroxy-tetrahydrodipicolinate reductase [Desulfovibrionaceae bacterium]|nr:4-hydroxy-tetrahydrodipicolinate reductase [Desulfovibrionaceae bacterium]MBF0514654.1 4-hydroxy-tetrahydrodipicolinate reductase [Desulfovibrionaceae bacterium]